MNIRKLYNKPNIANNSSKISLPPAKEEHTIIKARKNKLGWGKNKLTK